MSVRELRQQVLATLGLVEADSPCHLGMVYSRTGNQFFRENDGTSHMLVGGNIGKENMENHGL